MDCAKSLSLQQIGVMDSLSIVSFSQVVTVSLTLFAVIDMLGSIPVLIAIKNKMGDIHAGMVTFVSGVLMYLFFLIGEKALAFMGIDIASFAIAGSIVIFILGLEFFKSDTNLKSGNVVPIAFPIIAGSGTLTTIMSLKANFHAYNILLGIGVNLIVIFIVLRSLNFLERLLGPSGILVVRKFFGVILLAISVKIFKTNLFL